MFVSTLLFMYHAVTLILITSLGIVVENVTLAMRVISTAPFTCTKPGLFTFTISASVAER